MFLCPYHCLLTRVTSIVLTSMAPPSSQGPRTPKSTGATDLPPKPWYYLSQYHMESLVQQSWSLPREPFSIGAFCAAETAWLMHDWRTDGRVRPLGSEGFHRGFIRPALDRRATWDRCMALTNDLVRQLYHSLPSRAC